MENCDVKISIPHGSEDTYYYMQNVVDKFGTLPSANKSGSRLSYTTAEVAAMYGVSTKTVYRWIGRRLLPTSKVSRKLLIPVSAVENFMEITK